MLLGAAQPIHPSAGPFSPAHHPPWWPPQERIQQWRREQAVKARQDQAQRQAQRQCAAARRSASALLKERTRLEVYALNALLRM